MREENAIEVKDLKKQFKVYYDKGSQLKERILFRKRSRYEERRVLDGISFSVQKGEAIGLIGSNGCGKSTLLTHLKTPLTPHGKRKGEILFQGVPIGEMSNREQSQRIGYVLQNPDNQIVTDKVWHELAFGLESLGYSNADIRIRVAEMASYFGIQDWFYKNVSELSGGQKQLLNLASIMAMHPDMLILDEPTAALEQSQVEILFKYMRMLADRGVGMVFTSHRMWEVMDICDDIIVFKNGEVVGRLDFDKDEKDADVIIQMITGEKKIVSEKRTYKEIPDERTIDIEHLNYKNVLKLKRYKTYPT